MLAKHAYLCTLPALDAEPLPTGVRLRCDARCTKLATVGVRYPWGAAVYCKAHAEEEVSASVTISVRPKS